MKKLLLLVVLVNVFCACETAKEKKADDKTVLKTDSVFNFLVVGDWGRNGEFKQKEVANQMGLSSEALKASFIISTGDNFYDDGVQSIDDTLWHSSFENIYTAESLQKDWFVVLGNHDYRGNPMAEIEYTKKSNRWKMPDYYYTFTKSAGNNDSVRFIFIDTSPFVQKYYEESAKYPYLLKQDTTKQLRWLDSILSVSKEKWKIVIGHHPVYSASHKHGNTPELIRLLENRFEKYHVDAYFCGHDHDLQHLKGTGTVDYFVSGAGSETRPASSNEMTKFSLEAAGFADVAIFKDTMQVSFIDHTGKTVYKIDRIK
jgi:tartrate-resistant acid phosphatase type 5